VPGAVIGTLPSGVVEAETMVTVHEEPVIVVLIDPDMGAVAGAGHQHEGPGPASPPGLMMQQLPTPDAVLGDDPGDEQATSVPRITGNGTRFIEPSRLARTVAPNVPSVLEAHETPPEREHPGRKRDKLVEAAGFGAK
jgi:hypothetical protein